MSKPKTKRCWIVRQDGEIFLCDKPPYHIKYTPEGFTHTIVGWAIEKGENWKWAADYYIEKESEDVSPLTMKMWKKALKGKRGKNAVAEADWETWRPIIEVVCENVDCFGGEVPLLGGGARQCTLCKGTNKIKRPMVEGDL